MSKKLPSSQVGLTLVELMVAMTLGLFLLLGVANVYLAQRQSFRVNENLSQMQNNTRVAFELMAREIREAGGNPCGATVVSNMINDASTSAWRNWDDGGLIGFEGDKELPNVVAFGDEEGDRVEGTDALLIRTASAGAAIGITSHASSTDPVEVVTDVHGIAKGDWVMACDFKRAVIFQVTNDPTGSKTIEHDNANPGNCSDELIDGGDCTSLTGDPHAFSKNGSLAAYTATGWYVGNNADGGSSLFRIVNGNAGAIQEIARGVTNMQLQYLMRKGATPYKSYVPASQVLDDDGKPAWGNPPEATQVVAVRVLLDLESRESVGTDSAPLKRTMMHVVSLRHRELVNREIVK